MLLVKKPKHASRHIAGGADAIPIGGIARSQLEYPTSGVSFAYLSAINKLAYCSDITHGGMVITNDTFADKSMRAVVNPYDHPVIVGRCTNSNNFYRSLLYYSGATADHLLGKVIAGIVYTLATEAVDIDTSGYLLATSCFGSTLKSLRRVLTSPVAQTSIPTWTATLTATDTSLTSGRFGLRPIKETSPYGFCDTTSAMLDDPLSPTPEPIAFFEVPITGSGTLEDPFRAQMPEEIVIDWSLNPIAKKKYDLLKAKGFTDDEIAILVPEISSCRRNLLALTNSILIPTDSNGKPIHGTAIVRVFKQPDRDSVLRPIPRCLEALNAIQGVRKLTREEAIALAKKMDDKLMDVDLVQIKETDLNFKTILKDYIAHREALGVKRELIDDKSMEKYLKQEKGW